MSAGGETQTTTVSPDPATQLYQNFLRGQAMSGAGVALGQPLGPGSGFLDPNQLQYQLGQAYNLDGSPSPQSQGHTPQAGWTPPDYPPEPTLPGGHADWTVMDPFTPFSGAPGFGPTGGSSPIGPTSGGGPYGGGNGGYPPPDPNRPQFVGAGAAGVGGQTPDSFFTGPQQQSVEQQIQPFLNPYMDQVIGGVNQQFDRLRGQAQAGVNQAATQAGAFGGARHGVAQGVRLGEIDRAEGQQVGQLLGSGFRNAVSQGIPYAEQQRQLRQQQLQEPLFRQQQALGFLGTGLGGPSGQTSASQLPGGSVLGGAASGATAGSAFGPWGTAAGGVLGLLGSYL